MVMHPILSLCIPTYNRAEVLAATIEKIVSCQAFDDDVELVISDNCSTDNTRFVCEEYAKKYKNISYYCNSENIRDKNFVLVLNLAKGDYLKLLNDWCYYDNESLQAIKDSVRNHQSSRVPLFFVTGHSKTRKDTIRCHDLNEYINEISVMVTFNNLFGAWKEQWDSMSDKDRFAELKLQQVDWTYRLVSLYGCVLDNVPHLKYVEIMNKQVRKGYNYFEVMLDNYYKIMDCYVREGKVDSCVVHNDGRRWLRHFKPELFQTLVCHTGYRWQYDTTGSWRRLYKHFKGDLYFYFYVAMLPFQWLFHASVRDLGK